MKKRIPEIILGCIIVLLIGVLVWVQVSAIPYKVRENKVYDYFAYKLTYTDDSVTETLYFPDDDFNPIRITTMYLKDGKVNKIIEELHYTTIDKARKEYESELSTKMDTVILKQDKNILTRVSNKPEMDYTVEFKSNKEAIDYIETHADELHQNYKRVY